MGLSQSRRSLFSGMIIGLIIGVGIATAISSLEPTVRYTITTAGSTTVYPLSQIWAAKFHDDYPSFTVNPGTGGSGLGQSQVASGLIHIGASSSYPEPEFIANYPNIAILPVSADALGIVVNENVNGSVFKMDVDMAVAIFQRNVTTWEEFETVFGVSVRASGNINVYVRSDASGTTATFGKWLETADENANPHGAEFEWRYGHHESISWAPGIFAVDGNPSVAEGIKSDENGIGYVGLAFMEGLVPVNLYNPGNNEWVTPTLENVLNALPETLTDPSQSLMNSPNPHAYPIARLLYYLVNPDYLPWYVIVFLNWVLIQGQQYISTVGYVPISGSSALVYSESVVANLTPSG